MAVTITRLLLLLLILILLIININIFLTLQSTSTSYWVELILIFNIDGWWVACTVPVMISLILLPLKYCMLHCTSI